MSEQPIYVTRDGLKKLEEELEYLRTVKRAEVAQRLHDAMGEGDIDENAEYDDAKNEQSFVEGRILTLEAMIKNAVIIQAKASAATRSRLGSTVTVAKTAASRRPITWSAQPRLTRARGASRTKAHWGARCWASASAKKSRLARRRAR